MTLTVFREWPHLELPSKLKYLLVETEWVALENELKSMLMDKNKEEIVTRSMFLKFLDDYQDPEISEQFFNECDNNFDNTVDIVEYAGCRGNRDRHGNIYDTNEYVYREAVILSDFESKLQSADFQPDIYQYDEYGIIID